MVGSSVRRPLSGQGRNGYPPDPGHRQRLFIKRPGSVRIVSHDMSEAGYLVFRVDQFIDPAVGDHTLEGNGPFAGFLRVRPYLYLPLKFSTHPIVGLNKVDFFAFQGGVNINTFAIVTEYERHDIGGIVSGKPQTAHRSAADNFGNNGRL